MKLYPDKLESHLQKQLAPVYLLHGDEPLQLMEIGDRLRLQAQQAGYDERQVIIANDDSDWAAFRESADSYSLFADRRLIELRLPTGKPGRVGSEILKSYCSDLPDDIFLLITSAKLDRSASNSAWFKAVDKAGVTVGVWPVPAHQLGAWLGKRLNIAGLSAEPEALSVLIERVEGNLLAAKQEVERLALLYPPGVLSVEQVLDAVSDSARYSIGDLAPAALTGDAARALRVLKGLREESVSEVLVLWSLSNEIRGGSRAAEAMNAGVTEAAALKSAGVWQNRANALKKALDRHDVRSWLSMLAACAMIDRQVKGQAAGSSWESLETLVAQLATGSQPLNPIALNTTL